jgi:hypothetical protein
MIKNGFEQMAQALLWSMARPKMLALGIALGPGR